MNFSINQLDLKRRGEGRGGEKRGGEGSGGEGTKGEGGRKGVGRRGGRPGGGGTRLANCCIRSAPPSAPSEVLGSQRAGRARGSRASPEAEEQWRQG